MSGISYSMPRFQAIDQNGFPMFGATLHTYQNKTTTPAPTWRDKEQSAYNTNPIVLDTRGECVVWLDPEQTYTFVLRDWYGGLVWSQDEVVGIASSQDLSGLKKDLSSTSGSSMVGRPEGGSIADLFELNGSEYLPWRREKAAFADNVFMMLNASAVSVYEYADLVIGTSEDQSENDWAPAFQAAINRAEELGIGFVHAFGNFGLGRSVVIPVAVTLLGQNRNSLLIPLASGVFTRGFMFLINNNGTSALEPWPGNLTGGIDGFYFDNIHKTPERRGVLFSGSPIMKNLKGRWMSKIIGDLTGDGTYHDNVQIDGIHSEPVIGQEYQIDISALGDACSISNTHFPKKTNAINPPQNGIPNGIRVRGALGFEIRNAIGGNVSVERAVGVLMGGHFEFGTIYSKSSQLAIRDTYMCPHETYAPIVTDGDLGIRGSVVLDNVQFGRMYGLSVRQEADVLLHETCSLSVRNSYRRQFAVGNTAQGTLSGILVANRDGSHIRDFNHHSAQLSVGGDVLVGGRIKGKYSYHVSGTAEGISYVFDSPQAGSSALNGTYYYNSQIVLDPTRQILIDTAQAEKSITTTNRFVGLSVSPLTATPCSIRLYRGKAANSYTHTVDVPMIGSGVLVDDGNSVNGYAWNTITAAPMPPQISISIAEISGAFGGRAEIVSNSGTSPNRGTWKQGDLIRYGNAPSAGMLGAVCTVAGSPGTWKQYGRID